MSSLYCYLKCAIVYTTPVTIVYDEPLNLYVILPIEYVKAEMKKNPYHDKLVTEDNILHSSIKTTLRL